MFDFVAVDAFDVVVAAAAADDDDDHDDDIYVVVVVTLAWIYYWFRLICLKIR